MGEPIEELKTRVVSDSAAVIDGSREVCRAMECPMGNLVAEAMLDRVKDQGIQIAIQNGGTGNLNDFNGKQTLSSQETAVDRNKLFAHGVDSFWSHWTPWRF